MVKEQRKLYNASFSVEKYQQLLADIEKEYPNQLDFRVAESPVFVDKDLKIKLLEVSNSIIDVLLKDDFKAKTDRAIPANFKIPNEGKHPHFLAIDFAICKNEQQELEPQLIEIQGFPSLFGYQWYIAQKYRKYFQVPNSVSHLFNRLNMATYVETMRKVLLGNLPKEQTILLEIFPEKQKTRLDFAITKSLWGIETVCLTKIKKQGKSIFYEKDGQLIQIKRIYNRVIFDEIERNYPDLQPEFNVLDEIDAEWITHPNWFYRISKFTLPFLKHAYIPSSQFLSDVTVIPEDLDNYVLKPLFSFAGSGVKIDVTKEDIQAIKDPENYLLQRKVAYEPVVEDTNGGLIKTEIRLLYCWEDGVKRPKLVTNLARLSRGKMIGVDFNKNFDWVGGSCAFFETN